MSTVARKETHEIYHTSAARRWDRDAFGLAMRRVEVHLIRGEVGVARDIFETLVQEAGIPHAIVTLRSHVRNVFDLRTSNLLQKYGYATLEQLHAASDRELLACRGISGITVKMIRRTIKTVLKGRWVPKFDLAPDWDLEDLEAIAPLAVDRRTHSQ